jgi:ABC-2 type transport system permease protein
MRVLGAICRRTWLKTVRYPVALSFSFVQPLVWLVFFGFLFRRYEVGEFSRQARYLDFLLPGTCAMTVLFGASQSGVGLIRDIQTGFFKRLLASPADPMLVLGGKLFADVTRLLAQALVVLFVGVLLGAKVNLSLHALLACLAALALLGTAFSAVSCVVAMTTRAQESMGAFVQLVNMPLLFTSSALVPVRHMPDWLAPLGRANPLTLAVDSCREALLVGGFSRLPSAAAWLGFAAALGLALAYVAGQKLIRET